KVMTHLKASLQKEGLWAISFFKKEALMNFSLPTGNRYANRPSRYAAKPAPAQAVAVVEPKPHEQTLLKVAEMSLTTPQIQVPAALESQHVVQDHLSAGVLSAEKSTELWQMVMDRCSKSFQAYDDAHLSMQEEIAKFRTYFSAQNDELFQYMLKLGKSLNSDQPVNNGTLDHAKLIINLTKEINQIRLDSVKNLNELNKMNLELFLSGTKQVLTMGYENRLKDIEAVSKMILLVQSQEEHAQIMAVAYHVQQLKAESQASDQLLALARFQQDANSHERELNLKDQRQNDAREATMEELAQRAEQAEHDRVLDKERLENEHRAQSHAQAMAARQAETRTELNHRTLDIQEKREKALIEQYSDEYALKRAQLKGQTEKDLFKQKARIAEIDSEERRQLAQIRSQEFLKELGVKSLAELETKKHDAAIMLKLKQMEREGRCTII
ncbi:MAG: hypothetical protein LLG04_10325, partial [Parachlamydia sp.]|nr:hypothetical protein [Parachlamydia sp.]